MKAEFFYRDLKTGDEFKLELDIDENALAKKLAIRARRSKHKRASCAYGTVNAKIIKPSVVRK